MTGDDKAAIAELVGFWIKAGPDRWFTKDEAFDRQFRQRFLERHLAAARRELDGWLETADGGLALLLLLDQYPRNAFRGTAHMYATDPLARLLAARAIEAGLDQGVEPALRVFFYLPFEHSESLADHDRSVELHRRLGSEYEKYPLGHQAIIRRFGRFPHRNAILGRETTAEEQAFLDGGGFAG